MLSNTVPDTQYCLLRVSGFQHCCCPARAGLDGGERMTMARERDHAHMQRTAPLLLFSLSQLSHHIMEPLPLAQLVFLWNLCVRVSLGWELGHMLIGPPQARPIR
jgi:hypothetical protein